MDLTKYFKIRLPKEAILNEGHGVRFQSSKSNATLVASYIGQSRIDTRSMFKVEKIENGKDLADIFDGGTTIDNSGQILVVTEYPDIISTLL